ncbi:hypothetical protein ACFQZX_13895 [Mucilaginibacter litoreus]|uniref:Uncharacterized protein n=1 Tax=Mucilaginibacter litoreus TaxID=1048221 RepID=A0ABW3AV41_9SPHI
MNEQEFKQLMALSRLKQPFNDFEERMMLRLEQENCAKASAERYRKIAWLFFILGAIMGGCATVVITMLPGINGELVVLGCRMLYVILMLAALNYLLSGSRWRILKSSL